MGLSTVLLFCCPIPKRALALVYRRLETCQPKDRCGIPALSYIGHLRGEVSPRPSFPSSSYFWSRRVFDDFVDWRLLEDLASSELLPDSSDVTFFSISCAIYDLFVVTTIGCAARSLHDGYLHVCNAIFYHLWTQILMAIVSTMLEFHHRLSAEPFIRFSLVA